MKRTAGTILVAIAEMLFGVIFMLMALGMIVLLVKNPAGNDPAVPNMKGMFVIVGGMYGSIGAFAIVTAIGVLLAKSWARIVTLVAGGMLTFSALVAGAFSIIIPLSAVPNITEQQKHLIKVVMVSFWGFVALIGIWWIVLMTRPRIVELFRNQQGDVPAQSQRPLSITIIGGLFVVFAVLGFGFQLAVHTPFVVLGQIVSGTPGLFMNFVLAIVYVVLGVGLLRLDRRAYVGTLGLLGYGALNAVVMMLLPNRMEKLHEILKANPGYSANQVPDTSWIFSPWYTVFLCVIILGIPAYFLITRRAAFYRAVSVEAPKTLVV